MLMLRNRIPKELIVPRNAMLSICGWAGNESRTLPAPCGVCRKGSSYAKGNLHRESPGSVSARFASTTTWLPSFSSIAPCLCGATARSPASVASEHTYCIHAQIGLCGMLWAGQVTLKCTQRLFIGWGEADLWSILRQEGHPFHPVIVAPFYACARSPWSTPSA